MVINRYLKANNINIKYILINSLNFQKSKNIICFKYYKKRRIKMKTYFVNQMCKIRQYSFNISAYKANNGISPSKIKYLKQRVSYKF